MFLAGEQHTGLQAGVVAGEPERLAGRRTAHGAVAMVRAVSGCCRLSGDPSDAFASSSKLGEATRVTTRGDLGTHL